MIGIQISAGDGGVRREADGGTERRVREEQEQNYKFQEFPAADRNVLPIGAIIMMAMMMRHRHDLASDARLDASDDPPLDSGNSTLTRGRARLRDNACLPNETLAES